MITSRKNTLANLLFSRLAKAKMKKEFRKVSLTANSQIPRFDPHTPGIVIANHSSWWDALVAHYLSEFVFKRDSYGIYDEEQLRRYSIFGLTGGMALNKSSAADGRAFLRYVQSLLTNQERLIWVFPQGDLLTNDHLPLKFEKGFALIASHLPKVHLLSVLMSYNFWIDSKPEIVIDILPLETLEPQKTSQYIQNLTEKAEHQMTQRLGAVNDIVKHRKLDQLKSIMIQEHGANPVYDAYRQLKALVRGERFSRSHGS